ncbi:hypothetical protein ACFX1S_040417 [Malus domestica]
MFKRITFILLVGLLAWAYQAARPPPPNICGSPGGPPITAPRIRLRDGRFLAYKEHGVPKPIAKYKIIFVHPFSSSRHDLIITISVSPEVIEDLGVYIVSFDRPGYGESDPDPKRTAKSLALDIEELGDQLELGSKFYVIGYSMGGQCIWKCLQYIPHRLTGAALIAPVINYWWPGLPANLSTYAYKKQPPQDQWALRAAHYIPWLTYWWNTQKFFPKSSVVSGKPEHMFSRQDWEIIRNAKVSGREKHKAHVTQQGEAESIFRDMVVGFGSWEFNPTDLKNPFVNNEGSVHLWQGDEDKLVPVELQRYIAEKLPWIHYHEVPGEQSFILSIFSNMFKRITFILLVGLLAWAYQAARPPPPNICGSPGGPPVTASRIRLRDGRFLAYKEHGVPKQVTKYKIIFVHPFFSSRHDPIIATAVSPEVIEDLGVYIVSFDRPGHGESDPDPKRTTKSLAFDIEELGDQLELGSKFYVIGYSMGGQVIWKCLQYIPHRLVGAALIAPVINYWWPGLPANLSSYAYKKQAPQDQWALRAAHYIPWLTYWWNTQNFFPRHSVLSGKVENLLSRQDWETIRNAKVSGREKHKEHATQQGEAESIFRDMVVGFGSWEFDPTDLKNPFVNNEGSVHLWQGDEDKFVSVELQRYIAGKLPWIHYHELPGGGHLLPAADGMSEVILKALLIKE